ncbi:MAG: hypothetical protein FD123_2004 [Bacteroidetes bacterium]|nr:MAG: hypothetical protein FD123_2004 [Bacteroidota bacterium]
MIWATKYLLLIEIPPEIYLFAFGSTLFLYNAQRLIVAYDFIRIPEEQSDRHVWIRKNRNLLAGLAFAGGAAALYAAVILYTNPFFLKRDVLLKVVFWIGLLSVTYAIPFMRWQGEWIRLRDLPGMKIFLIAFVWTVVVVGIPFQLASFPETRDIQPSWYKTVGMIFFLEVFLFCIAITIPFDVRDMKTDKKNIRTIPQLMGEKNALRLGALLLFVVAGIHGFVYLIYLRDDRNAWIYPDHYASLGPTLIIVAWSLISAFIVRKASSEKNEMYFSLLLDGLLLLLPAGLFAASYIERFFES